MGVETAIAAAGIATEVASSIKSFSDAQDSRNAAAKYQADAARMAEEAKKGLSANYYKGISLPKETYQLQSEAAISAGAQAIQAGAESERGATATAGRIQAEQNVAQAGIRTDQANTMLELDKLTQQENSRLRDVGVGIDLSRAAGAQLAARDATEAAAAQTAQGFSSATSALGQGLAAVPLYQKSQAVKDFGNLQSSYNEAVKNGTAGSMYKDANGNYIPFNQALAKMPGFETQTQGVGQLNAMAAQDFMVQQPDVLKSILKTGWGQSMLTPKAPTINPMPEGGSNYLFPPSKGYQSPFDIGINPPQYSDYYGKPYRENAY